MQFHEAFHTNTNSQIYVCNDPKDTVYTIALLPVNNSGKGEMKIYYKQMSTNR